MKQIHLEIRFTKQYLVQNLLEKRKGRALADDHLVKEISLLREVLQQFILGHPNKILALSDLILVGCNDLRFEEEALAKP